MERTCSIEGCDRRHFGHGLCSAHLKRRKRWGDPLGSRPATPPCSVEACGRPAQGRGLCKRHWTKARRSGEILGAECSIDGCERTADARGWCTIHWKRWHAHGDPLHVYVRPARGVCSVDGCDDQHYGRGWCARHWQRWNTTGDPLGIRVPRPRAPKPRQPCTVDGCGRLRASNGMCGMHRRRLVKTGDVNGRLRPLAIPNRIEIRADGVALLIMTRQDGTETVSLFDAADHEVIAAHRWFVNAQGYVVSRRQSGNVRENFRLNRLLVGLEPDDPRRADHQNGDILDNRRANLRILIHRHNVAHQAIVNHRGSSRYRNVYLNRGGRSPSWCARIRVNGVVHHLGTFYDEEEAATVVAAFRSANDDVPSGY